MNTNDDLRRRILDLSPWFYSFDLGNGVTTKSKLGPSDELIHSTRRKMVENAVRDHYGTRLAETSVIDVGCHEGYFSTAIARMGVAEVLGVDIRSRSLEKAALVSDAHRLSNVRFLQCNSEDLNPEDHGVFDMCLCLGLVYHLENPLRTIRSLAKMTKDFLVLDSQIVEDIAGVAEWGSADHQLPYRGVFALIDETLAHEDGNEETGATPVALCPSLAALQTSLDRCGFSDISLLEPPPDAHEQYRRGKRVVLTAVRRAASATRTSVAMALEFKGPGQVAAPVTNDERELVQLERYDPIFAWPEMSYEHWHRYLFASRWAAGKTVLDIACGEGYGTSILADTADNVIGVDCDIDVIRRATEKYRRGNLRFLEGRAGDVPVKGNSVADVIVSFETFEHLDENEQISFLRETKRLLKKDGLLIISTPDKDRYQLESCSRYHLRELSPEEFLGLLKGNFEFVQPIGQRVFPASYMWSQTSRSRSRSEEHVVALRGGSFTPLVEPELKPLYIVALCSNRPLEAVNQSILIDADRQAFEQRDEQASRREIQLQAAATHVRAVEFEYANLQKEIDRVTAVYEQSLEHSKNLASRLDATDLDYTNLQKELERVTAVYEQSLEHSTDLASRLQEAELEFASLEGSYSEASDHIRKVETEYEAAIHQLDILKRELQRVSHEFSRLEAAHVDRTRADTEAQAVEDVDPQTTDTTGRFEDGDSTEP